MNIPAEKLIPFITQLDFPCGLSLKKSNSTPDKWFFCVGSSGIFYYKDGVRTSRPEHRALEEMNLEESEEAYEKPEKKKKLDDLTNKYMDLLLGDFDEMFEFAEKEHFTHRFQEGEKAVNKKDGTVGIVKHVAENYGFHDYIALEDSEGWHYSYNYAPVTD